MAAIPGTILAAKISPGDTTATFPTHEDIYGKGGLISVSNFSELSSIPLDRQKIGMTVHVNSDSQYYTLSSLSYPLTSYSRFFTKTLLVSGGNSNQWNSVYTYTNTNSSFDQASRSFVNANSAEILNGYKATSWVFSNSAREIAVSTVVNNTSANWNNAYNTGTVYQSNSATYATILFANNKFLPLSGGVLNGTLSIAGNLFVTGTASYINVQDFQVVDPLIYLGTQNPSDLLDIGITGVYRISGDVANHRHTGLIRNHQDKKWILFSNLSACPLSSLTFNPELNNPSIIIDTLRANIEGNLTTNTIVSGRLDVLNDIFSTNTIFDSNGNSNQWNSVYSYTNSNSAREIAVSTVVNNTSANWNSVFSSTNSNSAIWSTVNTNITANNIYLRDSSTSVGTINFGQNFSKLSAPAINGLNDKISLWDFKGTGSGYNYAIGAELNHVWFTMDVNNGTGGFKFYSRNNEIFKIRDDGSLILKANQDILESGTLNSLLLSTKNKADSTFTTTGANSANWNSVYTNVQTNSASWENFTNTTFNELTSLKANNQLVAGKYYRISDFQLMWRNQSINDNTVKMGLSAEPLIVLALSGNRISHEAKSELYPQDTVYYDIDATSSNSWGTIGNNTAIPNFKGWIYRRVDHKLNIDIPWDWRHITVNCCRPDMTSIGLYNSATTYSLYSVVKIASNKLYYSIQNYNTNNSLTDTNWWLPVSDFTEGNTYFVTDENYGFKNAVFINLPADTSTRIQQPTFTSSLVSQGTFQLTNCNNIKIEGGYSNVFLGSNINSNTIGNDFFSNTIGDSFSNNTIGDSFSNNTIGDSFYSNTIGNSFFYNTIGNLFYFNPIGNLFNFNIIGNDFYINTIGNNFNTNTIGNSFYSNTIGNNFNTNTIGNSFYSNTIGNIFYSNTIGNNFYSNTIGDSFNSNTIGNDFYINTIGNNFNTNTIGNLFYYNTIGNIFYYNTIGNNFFSNTIGNFFFSNTIGNSFNSNTIGSSFRRNAIEDDNTIGNVTAATHIYNNYNTRIFSNSNNTVRLSYFNANDQLVVTDPTA